MSLEAARLFLATDDARDAARHASASAAESTAREIDDDGGLIAYAQRLARRRDPSKAAPMYHLAPMAEKYEQAEAAMRGKRAPVYAVMHASVQHGKTSLIQADILRTLRRNPRARIGYASYASDIAEERAWVCRELAHGEGVRIHPANARKNLWYTVEGGYVYAGGLVGGQWTGRPFDKLYIDDPYSGPEQADSAAYRAKVENAIDQKILTRGYETMSVLLVTARWNPNDISAFFIRAGWPYVCLPAINDRGEALWPEVVPLAALLAKRDGRPARGGEPAIRAIPRRTWASLYQGRPVADGARIFDPAHLVTYDRLPEGPFIEAIGIDVAYGAKARNDKSAIVAWRRYTAEPRVLYLVETWLGHEPIERFACRTAEAQLRRAGLAKRLVVPEAIEGPPPNIDAWTAQLRQAGAARARRLLTWWYAGGTEIGAAGMFGVYGAQVHTIRAGIDKLARAQGGYVDPAIGGFTSTWGEGRIRWPAEEGEHARALRIQAEDFTGGPTDDDDGIDAAVAGHDAVQLLELAAVQKAREEQARKAQGLERRTPDGGPARLSW